MWNALTVLVALSAPVQPQAAPFPDDEPIVAPNDPRHEEYKRQKDVQWVVGPTWLEQLAGKHVWQVPLAPGHAASFGLVNPVTALRSVIGTIDAASPTTVDLILASGARRSIPIASIQRLAVDPDAAPVDAASGPDILNTTLQVTIPGKQARAIKRGTKVTVLMLRTERLFAVDGLNRLSSLDAADGRTIWVADYLDLEDKQYSAHEVMYGQQRVVFQVASRGMTMLNGDTGDFIKRAHCDFFPDTPAVVSDGALIYGNAMGRLGWELMRTCSPWWSSMVPGAIRVPPVLMGRLVAAAGDRGRIGVWEAGSGQLIWMTELDVNGGELQLASSTPTTGFVGAMSTEWPRGERLFAPNIDGWVYCFDHRNGRVRWKYRGADQPITADSVCILDRVYVQVPGRGLVSLATDGGRSPEGREVWFSQAQGDVVALFANRLIAFDRGDRRLSVIDPTTGLVLKSAITDIERVTATAPVDGDLVFVASDGAVQLVRPLYPTPLTVPELEIDPTPGAPLEPGS